MFNLTYLVSSKLGHGPGFLMSECSWEWEYSMTCPLGEFCESPDFGRSSVDDSSSGRKRGDSFIIFSGCIWLAYGMLKDSVTPVYPPMIK